MTAWDSVLVQDVAHVFNGKTPSKAEQRSEGHPVLKIKDVSELGKFRGKFESFVDESFAAKFHEKHIRDGDILILNAAHNADYVGSKIYRAEVPTRGSLATGEWLIIRASERLSADFAYHWTTSRVTRQKVRELVNGIHLYPKDVARLKIPLPPLPEQRRIAAILDQADALRAKRREALAQLDKLAQAIFVEMFGDPGSASQKFQLQPLLSLVEGGFQNGAYFPKENYSAGGTEMVHMSDAFGGIIRRGQLKRVKCDKNEIDKYALGPADIIIARRSLTYEGAAKPCMVPSSAEPLIFESSFIRIRAKNGLVTPLYIFHYLNNERVREKFVRPYVTQSTISGINQSNLAQVPVMLPPITLQKEFGAAMAHVGKASECHKESLREMENLFTSLQHRAFRGEL